MAGRKWIPPYSREIGDAREPVQEVPLGPAKEGRHELGEAVGPHRARAPGGGEPLERRRGAAAEAAPQLQDPDLPRGQPRLERDGPHAIVDRVEGVVVGEVAGPQRQPGGGEEDLLTAALAPEEGRVLARGRFRQRVGRQAGWVVTALLVQHRARVEGGKRPGGPEARPARAVLGDEEPARGEVTQHPAHRDRAAARLESGPGHDVLDRAPHGEHGLQLRPGADLDREAGDVLVEEEVRPGEAGMEQRHQGRRQHPGDPGGDVGDRVEIRDPRGRLAHGAGSPTGAQTSKKLNHCVGCAPTVRSRRLTQARAASSSPPRATTSGAPIVTW